MSASLSLFEKEHAAQEKYVYFLCGVAGALVAYLGKDFKPSHPLTTQATLMVLTLSCLVGSFLFGLGRILCYIRGISINKDMLVAREETASLVDALTMRLANEQKGGVISINKKTGEPYTKEQTEEGIKASYALAEKHFARMKKWFTASAVFLVICHVFLIAGFVLMIWAKVII